MSRMPKTLPRYRELPIDPRHPPKTAWGLFGDDDNVGMGYKILKDAGGAPLEVELMREIEALNEQLARVDAASEEAVELRRKVMYSHATRRVSRMPS